MCPVPAHMQLESRAHGTKVAVHDLFGNMPVRVRQRPADESDVRLREKEWNFICQVVTGMILALGKPILFTMKGADKVHKYRVKTLTRTTQRMLHQSNSSGTSSSFDASIIESTLIQGVKLEPETWSTWIRTSGRTSAITVRAVVSLDPSPSKQLQFLALGSRFVSPLGGSNVLYDTINDLFENSSFAVREEEQGKRAKDTWLTNKQLKGAGRGVDRWPMFFIRIDQSDRTKNWLTEKDRAHSGSRLSAIIEVLQTMVLGFLETHHFRPRKPRKARESSPRKNANLLHPAQRLEENGSESDMTIRRRNPLRPAVREKPTKSPNFLNDLGTAVKFPQTEKSQSSYFPQDKAFTTRIRTGSKDGVNALLASTKPQSAEKPATNSEPRYMPVQDRAVADSHNTPKNDSLPSAAADSNVTSPAASRGLDDVIRWVNPVTRDLVLLNARTGCVVDPDAASRPASVDGGQRQASITSSRRSSEKRLTRTSSGLALLRDGSWASAFFENWENPVFHKSEEAIPQVSLSGPESVFQTPSTIATPATTNGQTNTDFTSPLHARLSKTSLQTAKVISQVDSKFILVKATAAAAASASHTTSSTPSVPSDRNTLVLIDQHAASERQKIESLLSDLCSPPTSEAARSLTSPLGYRSSIDTVPLQKPLFFELHPREHAVFRRAAPRFAQWGILYDLVSTHTSPSTLESKKVCRLVILALPPAIAERCRVEPKLLVEMMRGEAWRGEEEGGKVGKVSLPPPLETVDADGEEDGNGADDKATGEAPPPSWVQRLQSCPQGLLEMLNSRACRSAVMFNDELSLEECEELVRGLARCVFPFQCAHGRPSLVPLVDLGKLGPADEGGFGNQPGEGMSFPEAWGKWNQKG